MALPKKLEKCVPCTTWKSQLIFCKCYQLPITFPHNLLKCDGQNSNSNSRAPHYVASDLKIGKVEISKSVLTPRTGPFIKSYRGTRCFNFGIQVDKVECHLSGKYLLGYGRKIRRNSQKFSVKVKGC
jgi:hypothetical protein